MPFAFLDRDLLDQNAEQVLRRAGDKKVRIASKSIRCVEVLRRVMASHDRYQGVLCFTGPEALALAGAGFDDLVVAYPTWEARHVEAVGRAVADGHRITLMVDEAEQVAHIDAIARSAGVVLPLCIDLDLSIDVPGLRFGVWRSPLRSEEQVLDLASVIARCRNVRLDGLMGYEAQIAGLPDKAPGQMLKRPAIRLLKKRSLGLVRERRAEVVSALELAGHDLRFVNGGGTGSLESTSIDEAVTEVTVGSAFYAPVLFDHYEAFAHVPAAGFAIEVVRRPAPGIYTCLGGGYIASGAPGPDKLPMPYLPEGARLLATEGAGEVQTPIRYSGPERLDLGAPVFMRHAKAGELCERFSHLACASGGLLVDELVTYRGQGWTFL
jgi:D-serine deaminase-like pyridoxal phosphate-dependent protein